MLTRFLTPSFFPSVRCLLCLFCGTIAALTTTAETVSPEDLAENWKFYGAGVAKAERGMFYMKESPGSQGVMIVSPTAFPEDVVVRYEIMPMNAASVCVVVMSASDIGDSTTVSLPADYDGSMGHWIGNTENYFFAFHNASHARPPFVRKFPDRSLIGEHSANVMMNGRFHTIEAGRKGGKVWLEIDGKRIIDGTDDNPIGSGHLAFRIRGLSEETAACLIKNVVIQSG